MGKSQGPNGHGHGTVGLADPCAGCTACSILPVLPPSSPPGRRPAASRSLRGIGGAFNGRGPSDSVRRWALVAPLLALLGLSAHAADRAIPSRGATSTPALAHPVRCASARALIQLAGQPLAGGITRGTVSLPLERAEGGHTPVLSFRLAAESASTAAGVPRPGGSGEARPIRLLLDTGATSTMVTPELAERLTLQRQSLPAGAFGLAGGGTGCGGLQPQRTRLPALELRDPAAPSGSAVLTLSGIEALVLPVRALPVGVDGVLGAPTLRLQPIRIDQIGRAHV